MFRYLFILMFAVGMVGTSSVAFGALTCTTSCDVDAAIKCVCKKPGTGQLREVACPNGDDDDDWASGDGSCPKDIECKDQETPNCVVTLPITTSCYTSCGYGS